MNNIVTLEEIVRGLQRLFMLLGLPESCSLILSLLLISERPLTISEIC